MPVIIVVENPRRWPLCIPGVQVVSAKDYLGAPQSSEARGTKVFNLCRRFGYQSIGYYVSLLATARGHRPLPSVATIQDLRLDAVLRLASEEGGEVIQHALQDLRSERFELSIYFGRNMAKRYDRLCGLIFDQFPAPFLRAEFVHEGEWELDRIRPIGTSEIPESHRPFIIEQAIRYFDRPRRTLKRRSARYEMAILVNPEEPHPPSDRRAIFRFVRAARRLGIAAEIIGKEDYGRIAQFDALFIRETTAVNHHTYRFARRAAAEGLVVMDDPESILRCTNKVYQAELFARHEIPTPRTVIVNGEDIDEVGAQIGYPCVVKRPDSSFSLGVSRADSPEILRQKLEEALEHSELAVVQEFVPSDFDWRVGIIDGKPLYVCKYYMVRGHWQIQSLSMTGRQQYGRFETFSLDAAPPRVVRLAVRAADLIGNGLYGVDIKQVNGRLLVMEINDNPSIDAGVEDQVLRDELYTSILRVFHERLERIEGSTAAP